MVEVSELGGAGIVVLVEVEEVSVKDSEDAVSSSSSRQAFICQVWLEQGLQKEPLSSP